MKSIKLFLFMILVPGSILLSGQGGKELLKSDILKAGFAKIDITPEVPVMLYGYASRKTPSEGVHDPLSARAAVFQNGEDKFVIVSTDLGSFGSEVFSAIQKSILRKFSLKESELFLSTIHSHSSPILSVDNETGNPDNVKYTRQLEQKLLTLIDEAFKNLKSVQVGFASGSSPVGSNRREMRSDGSITLGRNPYGPADKEVLVMKVSTSDGKSTGIIFDYATHSTSLGARNLLISGDVLGLSAQFVEKILGNDVVAPVFAGASGNIDPWYRVLPGFNTEPGWIPEPVLLGTLLGEEVVTLSRNIKQLKPGGSVNSSFATIECPAKIEKNSNNQENQGTQVPVNITVAKAGDDVAFIGFNVEMLTEIGMAIKEASPFKYTFIITHCNGSSGYLPPANLYKEGGYEITSTHFEIGSAEMVVKKALTMLYDLK